MLNLLLRFYDPTAGSVTLDGRDLRSITRESLRRHFALVQQETFLFDDSIIDNISVHKARMRMGEKLAEKIMRLRPERDIDVVIPIPDTSRTSALQLALALGVKYREGFVKNRYIGRTFIMPGQEMRQRSVRGSDQGWSQRPSRRRQIGNGRSYAPDRSGRVSRLPSAVIAAIVACNASSVGRRKSPCHTRGSAA